MSAQWKGAETASRTARFAPSTLQRSEARSTAAVSPAMTTCPGEFTLAGATTTERAGGDAALRAQRSAKLVLLHHRLAVLIAVEHPPAPRVGSQQQGRQ
jgi:hypothetical protein